MTLSAPTVLIEALLRPPQATAYVLALSGGRDSVALLHALAHSGLPVRAVHVHHGLQAAADQFATICGDRCSDLGVPLQVLRATVARSGRGVEADAREARYAALAQAVPEGAVLVTAHHAGDQAETVLMRVLRGTGVDGLAAMQALSRRADGLNLWRPWLGVPPAAIETYARQHALHWIDDPHNHDEAFTRVWLRRSVLPLLETRFPGVQSALTRLADLAAAAPRERSLADLIHHTPWGSCLAVADLQRLSADEQDQVLRAWLRRDAGQVPDFDRLRRLHREVIGAGPDRQPQLRIAGHVVRRYRAQLYVTGDLQPLKVTLWSGGRQCRLPGVGTLSADAPPSAPLQVRAAQPGDRLRPVGRRHHLRLQSLFQARGVPPWARARVPVLCDGPRIVAVADWVVADGAPAGLNWQADQCRENVTLPTNPPTN